MSYDFYQGGFRSLFNNWQGTVHPPIKFLFVAGLFRLFGISVISYTFFGLITGIIGLVAFYYLCKYLFSLPIARLACIIFATQPLILANALFSLLDYLLMIYVIFCLLALDRKHYIWYAVLASSVTLIKETGILLPISVGIIEGILIIHAFCQRKRISVKHVMSILTPFIVFYGWYLYTTSFNQSLWNEYIFTPTAKYGAVYTVFSNLITLHFLNGYAYQQWLQFFILNFNWVFWLVIILVFLNTLHKKGISPFISNIDLNKKKEFTQLGLFSFLYFLTVLSIQTFTIPRYALPLYPFFILLSAISIHVITPSGSKAKIMLYFIISILLFIRLFFSLDPFSIRIWNTSNILNENLYSLQSTIDGNDGITYNMQYLLLTHKRSAIFYILRNHQYTLSLYNCDFLFPDPSNDKRTLPILGFLDTQTKTNCN